MMEGHEMVWPLGWPEYIFQVGVSPENMDAIYLFQLRKLCFPSIRGPGGSMS
jgi:hypothetical protein